MQVELPGTAGPLGWPAHGCRCASCARMRSAGRSWEPTRVVVDGVPLERCPGRDVPGGRDVRPAGGGRLLVAAGPGARPEPAEPGSYDAVLLDLIGAPDHLARLRREGTVTERTNVRAVHNDHRISSPAELVRRLAWWIRPPGELPGRTLVLGGAGSGKSAEAELRLMAQPAVTYVATGPPSGSSGGPQATTAAVGPPGDPPGDPEWAAKVAAHRARRPPWWTTLETTDLPKVLRTAGDAVLIDGIATWLAAVMDETNAWDAGDGPAAARARPDDRMADRADPVDDRIAELIAAWRTTAAHVVAVSDEVGLSVVPATPAGRAFRDRLGRLNQRLAAESEEAILVVAGRAVELPA
jgi:adenosylcobinamide kinase / adenosylcobinamide-phosphate guanylyltransferase